MSCGPAPPMCTGGRGDCTGHGPADGPAQREVLAGEVERLAREHEVEHRERLARGARRARAAGRRRCRTSRAPRRPSPSRCRARADRRRSTSTVAAILASSAGWRNGSQVTRWPMRIVVVRAASAAASVQPSNVSCSGAAGAARWSISQTESKPAASAASVRSRMTSKLIRSWGRNSPNHGRAHGASLTRGRAAVDGHDLSGEVVRVGREEEAGDRADVGGLGDDAERDVALHPGARLVVVPHAAGHRGVDRAGADAVRAHAAAARTAPRRVG